MGSGLRSSSCSGTPSTSVKGMLLVLFRRRRGVESGERKGSVTSHSQDALQAHEHGDAQNIHRLDDLKTYRSMTLFSPLLRVSLPGLGLLMNPE